MGGGIRVLHAGDPTDAEAHAQGVAVTGGEHGSARSEITGGVIDR